MPNQWKHLYEVMDPWLVHHLKLYNKLEREQAKASPARLPKVDRPVCGARCRDGHPCQARVVWVKGEPGPRKRCRMHGAMGGPKTAEGRKRIADYQRRRWAAWRAAHS